MKLGIVKLTKRQQKLKLRFTRTSGTRGNRNAHFVAGCQSFTITKYSCETMEQAEWYRSMMAKALDTFYEQAGELR